MTKAYTSDPKGRRFISVGALLITVIIIAALSVLKQYVSDKFPSYLPDTSSLPEKLINIIMIVFAAAYVIFIAILLPMWYKTIKYTVSENEIISRSGLFSRTHRIMKRSAVQNAMRISVPFFKIRFNFIILYALGGRMPMLFLSDGDCREILRMFGAGSHHKENYSVAKAAANKADYVYKDNANILSSDEISNIASDYGSIKQLTFDDVAADEGTQLSFSELTDISSKEDKQ